MGEGESDVCGADCSISYTGIASYYYIRIDKWKETNLYNRC